jgi:hypothetical protein
MHLGNTVCANCKFHSVLLQSAVHHASDDGTYGWRPLNASVVAYLTNCFATSELFLAMTGRTQPEAVPQKPPVQNHAELTGSGNSCNHAHHLFQNLQV